MLLALYLLSGAIGLVYEVLWAKYLAIVFGSSAVAQCVVLAAFMGGLALGSAWLGPRTDRSPDPLSFYARLQTALAVLGLLPAAVPGAVAALGLASLPARAALSAAALLPPAFLMGGTLPALGRHLARGGESVGSAAARLYAVNSAGAVAGCLAAAYVLIPGLGLDLSATLAAAGSLLAGLGAFWLARRSGGPATVVTRRATPPAAGREPALLAAVFAAGFAALLLEVAWTRLFGLVMGSSVYSFAEMLAAFIAGVTLGAGLARRPLPARAPLAAYALCLLGAAAAVAAASPFYDRLPYAVMLLGGLFNRLPATFYLFEAGKLLLALAVMLVPTALLGMALPLAAAALARPERAGGDLGRLWAAGGAGNVAGALLGGLWLLPALGLRGAFAASAALLLGAGALAMAAAPASARLKAAGVTAAAAVLVVAALAAPAWDRLMLTRGDFRVPMASAYPGFARYRAQTREDALVYYRDDRETTVSVQRARWGGLSLRVNGKVDATSTGDMTNQLLLAHLPLLLRPGSKDVLVIGLGSGATAGAALAHPVSRVDVAELSPAVVEAARLFAPYNRGALGDPRLRVWVGDARALLMGSPRRWDVIVSEPSNTWVAGVASLFTSEFYRQARARLEPGGVFSQWFHTYEMDDATLATVLRTFSAEFSGVSAWETTPGNDLVLLGWNGPAAVDFAATERAFRRPEVREDLARVGLTRLTTVLGLEQAEDAVVRGEGGIGPLSEDRFPELEYEAPKTFWLQRFARLLQSADERLVPGRRPLLYLARYLAFRRRRLDPAEREEWRRYHERAAPALAQSAKVW